MKRIIIALFMCISTTVFSQSIELFELTRTMKCSPVEKLMTYLAAEYGEKPAWVGKEGNTGTYISIFKNELTGTWTMIQYDSRTGCVLGSGESGTPI
jgi:hypothetical protein